MPRRPSGGCSRSDLGGDRASGQLRLAFQPVVNAGSEDLVGFEALLRWAHPIRGLLGPADFLPLAEASGLIVPIGEWVVRDACAEAARGPPICALAINLSPAELEHAQLAATVASALAASGLDPTALELDLTEPALLADSRDDPLGPDRRCKALGVRLALDDFGAGATSLASLKTRADRPGKDPSRLLRAAMPDGSRAQAGARRRRRARRTPRHGRHRRRRRDAGGARRSSASSAAATSRASCSAGRCRDGSARAAPPTASR